MSNCTIMPDWPRMEADFVTPYNFEVFDFVNSCHLVLNLVPWVKVSAIVYVLGVVHLGPYLMRNRPALELRKPLIIWNSALALVSTVAFVRMFPENYYLVSQPQGFYKLCCTQDSLHYTTIFWLMIVLLTKFLELGDTVFLVLRKRKVIFLHWYHHLTVLLASFVYFETFDPGFRLVALINSLVHAFMYTYFAFRSADVKVPQKVAMAITGIQLFQFLIALVANSYTWMLKIQGIPCARPMDNILRACFVGVSYFLLFGKFFVQTYIWPSNPQKKKKNKIQ